MPPSCANLNYAALHNPFMPDDSFRIIRDDSIDPGYRIFPNLNRLLLEC